MTFTLRDYQESAVAELRAKYKAGARNLLFVMATGGGKTAVFSYISIARQMRGGRTIIFVHRDNLLRQISGVMAELGVEHGIIAPKYAYNGEALAVSSIQSFAARIKRATPEQRAELLNFDFWVVDEAHHAVSPTYKAVLALFDRAKGLGVTATPQRTDGSGLRAVFDDMVVGAQTGWLIEQGRLVEPIIFAPPPKVDLKAVPKSHGDYARGALAEATDKPTITGDAVAHYSRIAPGQPCVVFCCNIAHAKNVAAAFQASGYTASAISGEDDTDDQQAALKALASGAIQVLTTCDLIGEGTDIPRVSVVIMLRATTSLVNFLQWVGRALRPVYAPGHDLETVDGRKAAIAASEKPQAIILDHVGNVGTTMNGVFRPKHGFPQDEREWSLDGKPKGKRKGAGEDEPRLSVTQCPSCYLHFKPAPVCPHCGTEQPSKARTIEVQAGELVRLTPDQAKAISRQRKMEQGQARTPEDLMRLALARRHSKPIGWVMAILKSRRQPATFPELSRLYSRIKSEERV